MVRKKTCSNLGYLVLSLWLLTGAGIVAYGFYRGNPLLYVLIALVFLVAVAPIVVSGVTQSPVDIGQPLVFILVMYLGHFGIRALYLDHVPSDAFLHHWGSPPPYTATLATKALAYVLIGMLAMVVGYYLPLGKRFATSTPKLKLVFGNNRMSLWPIYLVIVVGLIAQTVLYSSGYGTATTGRTDVPLYLGQLQNLAGLLPIGVTMHLSLALSSKSRQAVFMSVILVLLYTVVGAIAGWRGYLIALSWMVILPVHYLRRRIGLRRLSLVGLGVVLVTTVVLVPIFTAYRQALLTSNLDISTSARLALGSSTSDWAESTHFMFSRLIGLDSLMLLVDSPSRIWGKTISLAFAGFVPRFLWPAKPDLNVGRLFAIEFWGQAFDVQNSMSVMTIGELLWNFDLLGVILGMLVLGIMYRWAYEHFLEGMTPVGVFVYTVLFTRIINVEATFGLLTANLLATTFTVIAVIWIVRLLGRRDRVLLSASIKGH